MKNKWDKFDNVMNGITVVLGGLIVFNWVIDLKNGYQEKRGI